MVWTVLKKKTMKTGAVIFNLQNQAKNGKKKSSWLELKGKYEINFVVSGCQPFHIIALC